jgi:hypothetical protein
MTGVCALMISACCPPPDVEEPTCPAPPAVRHPQTMAARAMPTPVLSRLQQPSVLPPTSSPPKRDSITEPRQGLPFPKSDDEHTERETPAEPKGPPPTATLPDEVILGLLETGKTAFVRCFRKAIADDPTELSFKVKLHVELDANGIITTANTDASNPKLDACLVRMAAYLKYPASGKPVAAELPLIYRGEP